MSERRANRLIVSHVIASYAWYALVLGWDVVVLDKGQHVLQWHTAAVFAFAPVMVPFFFAMFLVATPGRGMNGYVLAATYACLTAAAYFILSVRDARLQRERQGKCRGCGYDLRGTPQRCPECGVEPPAAAAAGGA